MRHPPLHRLVPSLSVVLLFALTSPPVVAQATDGAIDGTARRAENEEPIAFALVRLLPEGRESAPARQTVTAADGRWFFPHIAPGDYRVQLARIGYRPVLSTVLHVASGETVHHEIRAASEAIQLANVTVRGEASCIAGAQLASEPRLAALWNEAKTGVEIRKAFEQRYRFARDLTQDIHTRWTFRRSTDRHEVDTSINEPDSVEVRDARRRAQRQREGYMKKGTYRLALPNEKDLLDDEFLRDHCLEAAIARGDGAVGLGFRPIRRREGLVDIRGMIWVEADTYVMRRLTVEWLQGDRVFAEATVDYSDVSVNGSSLRLPAWGKATLDPGGFVGVLARDAAATIDFRYRDFTEVPR